MPFSDDPSFHENRRVLLDALEAARIAYWIWDLETGRVTWSDNLEEVHGIPKGSLAGTFDALVDLAHPEDRAKVRTAIERAGSEGTDYEIEFRVATPAGVEWISGRGHAERRDGRPVRVVSLRTNITARKTAEGDRRLLASIVRSSDDAILSKDREGRIMSWNAAAGRMYGYSAAEVIGQPVTLLVPPEKREEFDRIMEQIRRGERVEHYETLRRRRDGSIFEVSLTISPILDEAGRIIGASKIARDITAAKNAQRERERTRDLFLGILGHDLRNPLNTIVASLYSLQKSGPDPVRRIASRMGRAASRIAEMIAYLLDFTRARLGEGIPVKRSAADLRAICSDVIDEVEAQKPGRVRLHAAGDLRGFFDADRMRQAISNLVVNAIVHGSSDGPVSLRLSSAGGDLRVEVGNHGAPIPPAERDRIFEPFRRSPASEVRDSSGLGLGLFIAREIVRSHGGSIELESDPSETRFIVKLPAEPPGPSDPMNT